MAQSRYDCNTRQRHALAIVWNTLHRSILKMSHQFLNELERLNSARVGKIELSRLSSRDRVRAVKAALVEHHKGISRCC